MNEDKKRRLGEAGWRVGSVEEFLKDIASPRHLDYVVSWSEEDHAYVGLCPTFPGLSWVEHTPDDALLGIMRLIEEEFAADTTARVEVEVVIPAGLTADDAVTSVREVLGRGLGIPFRVSLIPNKRKVDNG